MDRTRLVVSILVTYFFFGNHSARNNPLCHLPCFVAISGWEEVFCEQGGENLLPARECWERSSGNFAEKTKEMKQASSEE